MLPRRPRQFSVLAIVNLWLTDCSTTATAITTATDYTSTGGKENALFADMHAKGYLAATTTTVTEHFLGRRSPQTLLPRGVWPQSVLCHG